jgi:hypothetical protein
VERRPRQETLKHTSVTAPLGIKILKDNNSRSLLTTLLHHARADGKSFWVLPKSWTMGELGVSHVLPSKHEKLARVAQLVRAWV